ncbi:MAG: aminopeptidase P family protein [Hydrogeniiclostridium sp.]
MSLAIQRLQEGFLREQGERAAVLVTSQENRFYLTGFPSSAGAVLVTEKKAYFLTDFRYAEAARRVISGCEVVCIKRMNDTLRELMEQNGVKRVFVEFERLSLRQAHDFETAFSKSGIEVEKGDKLDSALQALRTIKTPDEIQKLREAQKITDDAFTHILDYIRPGRTEREVALELEFFMRRQGAEGVSFDFIVVSGTNGSLCHGVPSDKKIEDGDFVTMDTGALLHGYHADMTRTVAVGHVSEEQRHAYDLVLQAQLAAIDAVRPGVPCEDIDKVARDILEAEYKGAFEHSLGHGVGVEIHEWPRFATGSKELTRPGMVVSVEPGIYLEGKFGLRIEDLVVITEDGCEDITKSRKDLIIL